MCSFFSFCGDGKGNYFYLDWEWRKDHLKGNNDSHTVILTHFKIPPKNQDRFSKYEYNPITKLFVVDEPVEGHDHESAEAWVSNLNFKGIIPQLVIKDVVHPFSLGIVELTENDILLLKQWDSVRDSVWDSVGDSVWDSVWDSVGDSVGDLVRDSVRGSVWGSVRDSVRGSVWGYVSTFFSINYPYDLSSVNELWNRGIVPSFDGKVWRLHSGKDAKIIYEWNKEEDK